LILSPGAGEDQGTAWRIKRDGVNSSDQFTPSLLSVFLTPVFFYVIQWFGRDKRLNRSLRRAVAKAPMVNTAQAPVSRRRRGVGAVRRGRGRGP